MSAIERFDEEVSGFAGGASGFGDPEFVEFLRSESAAPGTGLTVSGIQSVARRQLVGSVVVAVLVVAVAGFVALRPAHSVPAEANAHKFAIVQQPVFETPADHRFAAAKHQTELP
ncbi:MAG TPA: hypothetical protein VKS78_17300 [Roseiarcus sp.]|nr:hypothetical protein [Roseiarcus sp.]